MLARVSDRDPQMLGYLSDLGITVGQTLQVVERQPFDGPVIVRASGRTHPLGIALARAMRVGDGIRSA